MISSVLLVGLGQIGMGYDLSLNRDEFVYTHARSFSLHPAFDLVAAVDPSSANRVDFTTRYGTPAYTSLDEALRLHHPQVVVIAAPTELHEEIVARVVMREGVEAILCEKPLAYGVNDAQRIVETCRKAGVRLFVNYMRRVDKGVLEIKRRIDSGEMASPVKGTVWYSKGFLHNGSHFFNLLEYWLGGVVSAKILDRGRTWGNHDVEPDVHVEFERGKVVFLAAWEECYSHYTIELLSPSGRLRYERGGSHLEWQSTIPDPRLSGYTILKPEPEVIENTMRRSQWHVADQLAGHLSGKQSMLCTGEQAFATLEAMHKIINH